MGHQHIEATAHSAHDAATLHALLLDGASWPTWSGIQRFEQVRPGDATGRGEIRIFHTGRTRSREEVVEVVPGRRFSYVLLSGLPLKGYRADVDLEPQPGGGTRITWRSTFDAKIPGTGWFYRRVLGVFIQRTVDGLATADVAAAKAAG